MLAVLVEVDLHIPASQSLKDKRGVIRRLQARLRQDLSVSVAEVDHQDLWQRATLGVAIATGDETTGRTVADNVERIVARAAEIELLDIHVEVVATEEKGFSMATGGTRDPRVGIDAGYLDGFDVSSEIDPRTDTTTGRLA